MTKSAMAVPGLSEGQVNTVKILGSMWSKLNNKNRFKFYISNLGLVESLFKILFATCFCFFVILVYVEI